MCIVKNINIKITSVYSMFEIDNHITQFLEDFKVTLDNMTQTEFETLVSIFFYIFQFYKVASHLTLISQYTSLYIYISADALLIRLNCQISIKFSSNFKSSPFSSTNLNY